MTGVLGTNCLEMCGGERVKWCILHFGGPKTEKFEHMCLKLENKLVLHVVFPLIRWDPSKFVWHP